MLKVLIKSKITNGNAKHFLSLNGMKKNLSKIVLVIYMALFPIFSFADGPNVDPTQGKIVNPLSTTNTLPELIQKILTGVLKIGIPIVALAIVYCGFLFVFARGKPEELKKAREALLWTVIGAAILLGAWALAKMISATVFAL